MRFYAVLQHIVEHSIPLRASDGSKRREGKGGTRISTDSHGSVSASEPPPAAPTRSGQTSDEVARTPVPENPSACGHFSPSDRAFNPWPSHTPTLPPLQSLHIDLTCDILPWKKGDLPQSTQSTQSPRRFCNFLLGFLCALSVLGG